MGDKTYYVYILTNAHHTVLYVGLSSNLPQRYHQHGHKVFENAFTKRYNVNRLVYYESHGEASLASRREYLLKRWHRPWKEQLINEFNPQWTDLGPQIS